LFYRLGRAMYHRRWAVLALWLVVLLVSIPFVPRIGSVLESGGFNNGVAESDRANTLLINDLGFNPSLSIIFSSSQLRATDARFRQAMITALAPAATLPHVVRIDTQDHHSLHQLGQRFVSVNGHAALALLEYDNQFQAVDQLVAQVRTTIRSSTLQVIVAGDGAVGSDLQTMSRSDLQRVEVYALPIALLLILIIFGTLAAASMPLVLSLCSVLPTMALIFAIGHVADLSIFCLNVTTIIGLGVSIDYTLFIVSRFREQLQLSAAKSMRESAGGAGSETGASRIPALPGSDLVEDAIAIAIGTAGRAVLFSGVTVMIGLSGLFIFQAVALRSIGLGGSLVVVVSILAALTLLPALLGILGTRIEALPVVPWKGGRAGAYWFGLAAWVTRHPWPVIVSTLTIIGIIASPFTALRLSVPDATILPESAQSRAGFDILNQQFLQDQADPIVAVVHAPGGLLSPASVGALYDWVHVVSHDAGIDSSRTLSLVTVVPFATRAQYQQIQRYVHDPKFAPIIDAFTGNDSTVVAFQPRPGQSTSQLDSLVRRIRATAIGAGLVHYIGGAQASDMDYLAGVYAEFPLCILFVVIVTYAVLLVFLRSAILPLKAVFMNTLSLAGAYGAVVWIFQQGHLSRLFDFTPAGHIDDITPIVLFCILFGLSMDYEVFLLSRVHEEYLLTGDTTASVARGLERTGRIITSAGLILVVVAGSFAFANVVLIKAIGLGLAIAILLDATLIRCLLVPATIRVLGRWNWWLPGETHG